MHTCMHACMHAYIRTCRNTYIQHTYAYIRMCTYIHIHTCVEWSVLYTFYLSICTNGDTCAHIYITIYIYTCRDRCVENQVLPLKAAPLDLQRLLIRQYAWSQDTKHITDGIILKEGLSGALGTSCMGDKKPASPPPGCHPRRRRASYGRSGDTHDPERPLSASLGLLSIILFQGQKASWTSSCTWRLMGLGRVSLLITGVTHSVRQLRGTKSRVTRPVTSDC